MRPYETGAYMLAADPNSRFPTARLILVPSLITLAVTLLRLVGELRHWSKAWFNPEAGGPWSIVGITWLAPVFGIYFAMKLAQSGEGPTSVGRAIGFAILGAAVMVGSAPLSVMLQVNRSFYGRLLFFWIALALAAVATLPGWPALFKTLLAYGYAARIPVAIAMFCALRGHWGTHYDAPPPDVPVGMGLWLKYLWLGFFPQLIMWVGFTIVAGMLFGSLAGAVARRLARPSPAV